VARFSAPVQTIPGSHPYNRYQVLPRGKERPGVTLAPHPF